MFKRNHFKTDRSSQLAGRKKLLIAGAVLLGSYLIASFVLGEMGLIKYFRMRSQYNGLAAEIASLKQDNARLI
jgi:cell division protein FtsB